jgi:5-formyltetrahydrofolate cyclo-ligase
MPVSRTDVIPAKRALRQALKAERAERSPGEREQVERAIAAVGLELGQLRRARCVSAYASLNDEPGTTLLRAGLRELGIRVLLPVVPDNTGNRTADRQVGRTLDWAEDDGELTAAGALNLPQPSGRRFGPDEIGKADVILVPALAVDSTGTRLGRGGGYYDCTLTRAAPNALVLALLHDSEVLDATITPIPREPHDVGVHGVITPTRWLFFSPGRE